MEWSTEATDMMKKLLGEIPAFMRPLAEQMGRSEVAKVAAERGAGTVDVETLVIGLIRATPANLKDQMKQAMVKHGIDLTRFQQYL